MAARRCVTRQAVGGSGMAKCDLVPAAGVVAVGALAWHVAVWCLGLVAALAVV